jgi:UDP-N-acetyl-D-glucosamine dehydrogenase
MLEKAVLSLEQRIADRTALIGVIGLGYVGLPLAITAANKGWSVVGFDIDPQKIAYLERGESYITAVAHEALSAARASSFSCTSDFSRLSDCEVIVICVPTPLGAHREPDLSFVEATARTIAKHMTPQTLVILESTSFPGTTDEVLTPILEESGLTAGSEFFVGFSPEREDPGNESFSTSTIPKIVAGDGETALTLVHAFYSRVVNRVVPVRSNRTAEAVKITENVFRAVNIALVNELKVIYDAMGIDIWEVIEGASTKPFGYMPFYPGPGLGGHCIPIDPYYLTWKAREFGLSTRFVEIAGEINVNMPLYVIQRLRYALDTFRRRGVFNSKILVVGIAYKKNVPDMRESPALRVMDLLMRQGATVDYYDPLVPTIQKLRDYPQFEGMTTVDEVAVAEGLYDAAIIITDHDNIDYSLLEKIKVPIVDTRNVFARKGLSMDLVTKA